MLHINLILTLRLRQYFLYSLFVCFSRLIFVRTGHSVIPPVVYNECVGSHLGVSLHDGAKMQWFITGQGIQ